MVALTTKVAYAEGFMVLLSDRMNAFNINSMYLQHILPALAEIIPRLGRYAINVYGRDTAKLPFATGHGTSAVILSVWEVRQG